MKGVRILLFAVLLAGNSPTSWGQGLTAFTYQGRLDEAGNPVTGFYDFTFKLFNAADGGGQVGGTFITNRLAVTKGLFSLPLDFGPGVFDGSARWLELAARTNGAALFDTLAGRQQITATPYAICAANFSGSVADNQLSANIPRLNSNQSFSGVVTFNHADNSFTGGGAGLTALNASQLINGTVPSAVLGNAWGVGGNAETTAGANFIGTTDSQALELKVDNIRALRLEPNSSGAPNMIGGSSRNFVTEGIVGGTIGGGGAINFTVNGASYTNRVTANFGTVGGGAENLSSGDNSTTSGGHLNVSAGVGATVAGGHRNTAAGVVAAVGGGSDNQANARRSVIGGGYGNLVETDAFYSTIGGGELNLIRGWGGVIGGGAENTIQSNSVTAIISGGWRNNIQTNAEYAVIGGGRQNVIQNNSAISTISGGYFHTIGNDSVGATIGGGGGNVAIGEAATVSGGSENRALGIYATVSGGYSNRANAGQAAVGGGRDNTASGDSATVGGGTGNTASGFVATVAGGSANTASESDATIAGGRANTASGAYSTVGGGFANTANEIDATVVGGSANTASGFAATVAGGSGNLAGGSHSFAAGRRAKTTQSGSFVWGDYADFDIWAQGPNQFVARARGGVAFAMAIDGNGTPTVGLTIPAGGNAWQAFSDRNAKENFTPVDTRAVLDKVVRMPITEWNLKSQAPSIRHMGAMAQDFKAAFGLGHDDKSISTSDADGVALAAIQGLNQKLEEQRAENAALKRRLEKLEQLMNDQAGGAK